MIVEILEPKIKERTADLFYDRPYEATAKDGRKFAVNFVGEVRFTYNGKEYYENTIHKAMRDSNFNDKALENIEFESNGWLEVSVSSKDNECDTPVSVLNLLDGCDIAGDYDGGLDLLKSVVKEYEKEYCQ